MDFYGVYAATLYLAIPMNDSKHRGDNVSFTINIHRMYKVKLKLQQQEVLILKHALKKN